MTNVAFVLGQGGKHRDTEDAARWRRYTTHIMSILRESRPEMSPTLRHVYAEESAAKLARMGW